MNNKIMRKIYAIVMAFALVLVMTPAMKANAEALTLTQQDVTAPATPKDAVYNIYQVASAELNGSTYDYTVLEPFNTIDAYDTAEKIAEASTNSQIKAMADAFETQATSATAVGTLNAGETTALDPGYYLIIMKPTGTSMSAAPILMSVRSDTGAQTITAKTADVPFNKEITAITDGTKNANNHVAEGKIGSVVTYKLSSVTPKYATTVSSITTSYMITDTPSEGITIDKSSIVVKVAGSAVTAGATTYAIDTAPTGNEGGFTVTFADSYILTADNMGKAVEVTFDARINEKAVIEGEGNPNDASLDYDNDYSKGSGSKKLTETTKVYTAQLVITKENEDGDPLPGAGFTLYKADGITVAMAEKKTTSLDGGNVLNFKGLAAGTYVLSETTVPTGYAKAEDKTITITATMATPGATNCTYSFTGTSAPASDALKIVNIEGKTLPGTGGSGTQMFTYVGAGLIFLAFAMFAFYALKRKTSVNN